MVKFSGGRQLVVLPNNPRGRSSRDRCVLWGPGKL
jgi:hypothetical protein